MMDPKYFGSNAKMLIACRNDISTLIQLINFTPSPFKIKYFGVPPEGHSTSNFLNLHLQNYLTSYLNSVTQSFNPDLPIESIKALTQSVRCDVAKHWSLLPPSDTEIDARLIFITVLKIAEKSLHSLHIKCIYRNFTENTCEMLKRLQIEQICEDLQTSAGFSIAEKYHRMQDVRYWELSQHKIYELTKTGINKAQMKKRNKKELRKCKQQSDNKPEQQNKRQKVQEDTEIDIDDVKSFSSTEEDGEDKEMTNDVIQQIERYIREIDDALTID